MHKCITHIGRLHSLLPRLSSKLAFVPLHASALLPLLPSFTGEIGSPVRRGAAGKKYESDWPVVVVSLPLYAAVREAGEGQHSVIRALLSETKSAAHSLSGGQWTQNNIGQITTLPARLHFIS